LTKLFLKKINSLKNIFPRLIRRKKIINEIKQNMETVYIEFLKIKGQNNVRVMENDISKNQKSYNQQPTKKRIL
jgi:hypothetical protein